MRTHAAPRRDIALDLLVALAFGLFAFAVHAFQFNRSNNFFHIPIVLDWHLDPLFAADPFVLALQSYATPFYVLLRPIIDADTVMPVFHLLFALCRGLTLFALLQLGRAMGLADARGVIAFALVVAAARASYGSSPVGDGGLFINYMTHTEFAQAFAILGIAMAIRGRPAAAGFAGGLAFAINAFVGVWALVPIGGLAAIDVLRGRLPALRRWLVGAACFAIPAVPVALFIVAAQREAGTLDVSYREYLQFYYGHHFFIGWSSWGARLTTACAMAAGGLATLLLLPRWRPLLAFVLFVGIFLVGIVVGEVATSRLVLNLHMLRSDGLMLWLAIAAVAAASLPRLQGGAAVTRIGAMAALAGLLLGAWWLAALGMALQVLLPARAFARGRGLAPRLMGFALAARGEAGAMAASGRALAPAALALGAIAVIAWVLPDPRYIPDPVRGPTLFQLEGSSPVVPAWRDVKAWAMRETPAEARFLIPLEFSDFLSGTRRRVWVSQAEGGTAPWAPQTYRDWRRRYDEVAALRTEEEALAYARARGLDYVIFDKRPRRPRGPEYRGQTSAVFENPWFAVVRVPR